MKTLNDFLKELEAPEGYYCFSSHSESNETRIEGPIKIEQLKNSLKIKAAKIIRVLTDCEAPHNHALYVGYCMNETIDKILEIINNND